MAQALRRVAGACSAVILISWGTAWGNAPTVKQLVAPPMVSRMEISPDGRHLALRVLRDGRHSLLFLDRETLKTVGGLHASEDDEVGNFDWVNDERVVGQMLHTVGWDEAPRYYGELFGINFDGSHQNMLYGFRSGQHQAGTRVRQRDADHGWASVIDVLLDDPRRILISAQPWSEGQGRVRQAELLDVYSGKEKPLVLPVRWGDTEYFTDTEGDVRVITSMDDRLNLHVQALPAGGDWVQLPVSGFGRDFRPLAITPNGSSMYVADNPDDRIGLYQVALDGTRRDKVYEHEQVDVAEDVMSTDGRAVYALRLDDGYPHYVIFSDAHAEVGVFRTLLGMFPGSLVSIEGRSRDARFWIVKTASDRDAGTFYLYDGASKQAQPLFTAHQGVPRDQLAATVPVSFASFDGTTIHGYFTAAGKANGTSPLVVLVHGGPAYRDSWGYRPVVQVLATAGFSVLQINYRGSTGYGRAFLKAGDRQWGDGIQRDIIAGTRWAIEKGMAPANRICIMGASFGAYSAVQSAILAPELYACVVANAGPYDLTMMYGKGDIPGNYFGPAFLDQAIGHDEEELRRYSPVYHVDRLRAPIFIAHGGQDQRVPIAHARRLRRALEQHHKSFQWFVKKRENHGFFDTADRVEYLQSVVAFLRANLGTE